MKRLKIAYFGSPDFSAWFLEKLLNDKTIPVEVALVVTQKDKPAGRKRVLTPTPVKQVAQKYKLPVFAQEQQEMEAQLAKCDLALLLFYGKIIPKKLLTLPKNGFWNIHFSALPKYRGGYPFVYSLMMGDKNATVSIFKMDERLDHGPILLQQDVSIDPSDRRIDLERKCTATSYQLFKKTVLDLQDGTISYKEQDHTKATYTKLLKKDDGFIAYSYLKKAAEGKPLTFDELPNGLRSYLEKNNIPKQKYDNKTILNVFRGLHPTPGLWTLLRLKASEGQAKIVEKRLKITDMDLINKKIVIKKVQLEGKNEVDYKTFIRAYKIDTK